MQTACTEVSVTGFCSISRSNVIVGVSVSTISAPANNAVTKVVPVPIKK